jgi:hypothetical protein
MGCCVCVTDHIRINGLSKDEINLQISNLSNSFNDLSLSSESDLPHLTDWLDFKKSKVSTESTGLFSSFNCSKKNKAGLKVLSNSGSIVDSFVVTLPTGLASYSNLLK